MATMIDAIKEAETALKLFNMGIITKRELEGIYNEVRQSLGMPKLVEFSLCRPFPKLPPDSEGEWEGNRKPIR